MTVEPLSGHATAVVNRARVALECIIIGDDHAAFARGHQLAGLKAECASRAEGANALTAPLAGMGVRGVLDQRDPFVAGEVLERVQVRDGLPCGRQ